MNWLTKVVAYKLLSALPGGAALYRYSQEHITKSLVPKKDRLNQKIDVGLAYLDWLTNHGLEARLIEGVHLDFGAGWHPTIPLLYYCLGVKRQHLFDAAPVLTGRMLKQTIQVFLSIAGDSQWPNRTKLRRLPPRLENGDWRDYLGRLGMSYHAPYADVIPSLACSVDVATATQTLPYVRRAITPWCLSQIHGSLKSGGVFLATIHLRDNLAGLSHTGLTKYQHLRYSPETWERRINSSLMSFNRFKAPDYRELLEKAGFEIRHFEVEPGTDEEIEELNRVRIDPCFQRYSREELAARHLFFVAQKP
jgi:SAM-dependent methyltransferase